MTKNIPGHSVVVRSIDELFQSFALRIYAAQEIDYQAQYGGHSERAMILCNQIPAT